MTSYEMLYKELRKLVLKIKKEGAFSNYTANDFFYLEDEKKRAVLLLAEKVFNGYGIQIFAGNTALNYLHDLLTTKYVETLQYYDAECMVISIVSLHELSQEDSGYLSSHKIRRQADINIVPSVFKEGYGHRYANKQELEEMIAYLYYVDSLFTNEKEALKRIFSDTLSVCARFDNETMTYDMTAMPLPSLEVFPKKKKADLNFAAEFADSVYVDESCYFFHSFIPQIESDTVASSILVAYYPKRNQYYSQILQVPPTSLKKYLFGFLSEAFTTYGLPTSLFTNRRSFYAEIYKTLQELNIEVSFVREEKQMESVFLDVLDDSDSNLSEEDIEETEKEVQYIS